MTTAKIAGGRFVPCSTPGCVYRMRHDMAKCKDCKRHDAYLANRPKRFCRHCKCEIEWKPGQATCIPCSSRGKRNHRVSAADAAEAHCRGDTLSVDETARAMGISNMGVRLIEARALRKFARNWQLMFGLPLADDCH